MEHPYEMLYGYQIITCTMTSRHRKKSRSRHRHIWSRISRKRLEICTWFQWSNNRKPIWGIESSRDRWRHVTLKGQGRDPSMFRTQYLENGWRLRVGFHGAPIEMLYGISNGHVPDDLSWPQKVKVVTQICLGQNISKTALDRELVTMEHLEKCYMGDRMVTCPMTLCDPKRSRSCPRYIWSRISRKRLEIGAWFQWSTNRKQHMGNRIVTWSVT